MSITSPKATPSVASGLCLLALQSVTAPPVLVLLSQPTEATPRWLSGLYIALELGALLAGVLVFWGLQTKRDAARFAPAVLLLPAWLAVTAVAPLLYQGAAAAVFAAFALSMGALTSLPFLSRAGRGLFVSRSPAMAPPPLASASLR